MILVNKITLILLESPQSRPHWFSIQVCFLCSASPSATLLPSQTLVVLIIAWNRCTRFRNQVQSLPQAGCRVADAIFLSPSNLKTAATEGTTAQSGDDFFYRFLRRRRGPTERAGGASWLILCRSLERPSTQCSSSSSNSSRRQWLRTPRCHAVICRAVIF